MSVVKNVLIAAVLVAACFFLVQLGLLAKGSRALVSDTNQKLDGTFRNLNAILVQTGLVAARVEDASRDLSDVAAVQKKYWLSIGSSSAQLVDKANSTLGNISTLVTSLDTLVKNTDAQINGHLLPATEETLVEAKKSLTTISNSASMLASGSQVAMNDLHAILADESWQKALRGLSDTSENAAATAAQIAEAAKQLPSIASSMERIAKTSSKWQKFQIPISIASLIWRTFF
jgi:hypothetical protein